MANRRREVRSLIDSGDLDNAEARLTHWQRSGEDAEGLRELQAYLEANSVGTESVTGMKFQKIPGGSFRMGSPSSEHDRGNDETPHTVRVGEFWLGATEVTQAQWQAVMGSNPSHFKGDDRPVEKVSWNDVQVFIKKLNARTGKRFRLPTEAEWEYACREGGRKVRFCNGKDEASKSGIHYGRSKTKPVASFAQNSLGGCPRISVSGFLNPGLACRSRARMGCCP